MTLPPARNAHLQRGCTWLACCSILFSTLFLLHARSAAAQSLLLMEGGARVLGLGGAATALEEDVWGYANPATWSTLESRSFSLFASQAFGLSEMRTGALAYAEPTRYGTIAGRARSYGFDDYRETHVTLGFGRPFRLGSSRAFHAAATLSYYHVAVAGPYGSAGTLGLSVGWMVEFLPTLQAGFHATNINFPKLNDQEELPRTFALGLAYQPDDRLRVLIDGMKDMRWPLSLRAGLEFYPVNLLALRTGVATEPTRFTVGAGLHIGRIRADLAALRHEVQALGWSPAVSLGVQW